jgi:hypothetical protein
MDPHVYILIYKINSVPNLGTHFCPAAVLIGTSKGGGRWKQWGRQHIPPTPSVGAPLDMVMGTSDGLLIGIDR